MQKGQTERNSKNDGDGRIYATKKKRDIINETEHIPTEHRVTTQLKTTNRRRAGESVAEQQLDAARQVLETLEEQINNLDGLQQRTSLAEHPKHSESNDDSWYSTPSQRQQLTNHEAAHHHRALALAIKARKLALDHYIEHGLREDRCGCHFEHHEEGDDVTVDCLCAAQIDCQECGSASVDEHLNEKESDGGNLLNYIEPQQHLATSRRESIGEDYSASRRIEESSYRRGQSELFIDAKDKAITGSESDCVPQGLKAKLGGSRRQNSGANYSHYYTKAASTTSDESSIDLCRRRQTREERNLYEIERRYSQRLTGFRLSASQRHEEDDDDENSCSSECRFQEEEEIGNALVESDSLSVNLSSLSESEPAAHQLRLSRGQLVANYSSQQCSLTEDNSNNNYREARAYENHDSKNENNSSSSSLSLSWSQDFLKTLSIKDYDDDDDDDQEDEEALLLINSLFPRSSSEGRIDLELCINSKAGAGRRRASNYNGTSGGSDSVASPTASDRHEQNRGLHKQRQQQQQQQQRPRRYSTGSGLEELYESCNRTRYNWSSTSLAVASSAELDFCEQHSITTEATTASGARGDEQPASSSESAQECCPGQQSIRSKIEFDGGQRVQLCNKAAARPSMRAVRDIAKMSVPSLSALQYLPSQMDQLAKSKLNRSNTATLQNNQSVDQSGSSGGGGGGQLKVIEETGSVKHDESCLFHRLCMCSCVSRQPLAELDEDDNNSKLKNFENSKKPNRNKNNNSSSSSSISGRSSSSKRPKSVSPTNCGPRNDDEDERCSAKLSEEEKQSPSFLSLLLLRPGSPGVKKSKKRLHQSEKELSASPLSRHDNSATKSRAKATANSPQVKLGSDGNLIQSRASSAQDGDFTSDTESASSSLLDRGPSSLSSSAFVVAAAAADSSLTPENDDNHSQIRSKSACSTRRPEEVADEDDSANKTSKARRFLSPRRLFSLSPSRKVTKSSGGLESLVESETSRHQQQRTNTNEGPKSRSSFLSRSLTRLASQRAASKAAQLAERPENDDTRPSLIVETNSQAARSQTNPNDPISSSVQFIPGKHFTLAAPEIVLDTVEFQPDENSISSSTSATTMTRFDSCQKPASSSSRKLILVPGATTPSNSQDHTGRACSLPASPRRYRRTSGNRSPRLRESPVSFRSPSAMSTKIEDGLKVCSTEHFEKHIDNVKGNQDEAQAKLFKAWINHFHPNLIRRDLVDELRDGIKLIGLLASLTHNKQLRQIYEKLNNDKQSYVNRLVTTPSSRLRHLSNVSVAVNYLRQRRRMKLVNLNPMDIVSGKPNVILGLCWNIILNFQLEQPNKEQPATSDTNNHKGALSSSNVSYCTSRLSSSSTNEDSSKHRANTATPPLGSSKQQSSATSSLIEEYGTNDLIAAKRKLLERINRRFNLKLTNLTSNLLDGDVLLAIIRRLVPNIKDVDSFTSRDDNEQNLDEAHHQSWSKMSNEEKLDCCFDIAETHLGIPRLFDGSDLNSPDGTKSSLIYLSMLLNSEQASVGELNSERPTSELPEVPAAIAEPSAEVDQLARIERYLNEIDRIEDKFEIGQLDSTLNKIRALDRLVDEAGRETVANAGEAGKVLDRCQRLKEQANQIEALIKWINEADNLLEGNQQKSAKNLAESIEDYRRFFSAENLPMLETTLCPTLERQYRECLSSAKQRVLSMEQTLKNWISYEEARGKLKEWLIASETKLVEALDPPPRVLPDQQQPSEDRKSPLARHSERLDDLIEYFELENVDEDQITQQQFASEQMPISLMVHDSHHYDSVSLSGSLISLGSTSSRLSTLQSSMKASYHKLFDDFELKCRLLAAGLDREQRESLLQGVKELRCRLRIITEQRVPQVINELRMSISRCEMSIQEHDDENDYDDEIASPPDEHEARSTTDVERNLGEATQSDSAILSDSERYHSNSITPVSTGSKKGTPNSSLVESPEHAVRCSRPQGNDVDQDDDEPIAPLVTANKRATNKPARQQAGRGKSSKSRKSRKRAKAASNKAVETNLNNDPVQLSVARRIWKKLVRAFRTSLPLNIVLLVCLAGLCVVPMIQNDACCGMAQQQIPVTSNNIKPV